jgi:hypothetical protein
MVSTCTTSSYIFASDNGDYIRKSSTTKDRKGLKKYRTDSKGFRIKASNVEISDTITGYIEVFHPRNGSLGAFVPCIPSKTSVGTMEASVKNSYGDKSHTAVHNGQVALIASHFREFEAELKVFKANKFFENLPNIPNEDMIFAGVVQTNSMDEYGNVTLAVNTERVYFSLIQRGKVEIAEARFEQNLVNLNLPTDRESLIHDLDKIPREPLNISDTEMKNAISTFQQTVCGTTVLAQPTVLPLKDDQITEQVEYNWDTYPTELQESSPLSFETLFNWSLLE